MKYLLFKGFIGTVEYSAEDKMFYGKMLGIEHVYLYEGSTREELIEDFKATVEEYIRECESDNISPEAVCEVL